jgi:alpha-beta hydrolase superfamily lysophospholipase
MRLRPLQRWRLLALFLVLLVACWMGAGVLVAWRLTHRARGVFPEPPPPLPRGLIEPHRLIARDGVELGAWLVRGEPGAPCVLVLHGNGGSRTAQRPLIEWLAGEGACVLALSLRAHGDSGGEVNDFGWSARQDLLAGIAFLEREAPDRPRVVFGSSLGAATAIFAAREAGPRVQGYVLESPYRDLRTAVHNRMENNLPPGLDWLAFQSVWRIGGALLPVPAEDIRPLDHVADIPERVPVLLLAGALDRHARLDELEELARRVATHARLEVFPSAAHGGLWDSEPERYRQLLRSFVSPGHH